MNYQQQATAGMSALELVVALYDGMARFLYRAIEAIHSGDEAGRRVSIGRALDIVVYLQARLRMDVGGSPAVRLGEFYAAMFALMVRGSRDANEATLMEAIGCIRSVREAWQVAARDPLVPGQMVESAAREQARVANMNVHASSEFELPEEPALSRWMA